VPSLDYAGVCGLKIRQPSPPHQTTRMPDKASSLAVPDPPSAPGGSTGTSRARPPRQPQAHAAVGSLPLTTGTACRRTKPSARAGSRLTEPKNQNIIPSTRGTPRGGLLQIGTMAGLVGIRIFQAVAIIGSDTA
jgi:hypothetical protein